MWFVRIVFLFVILIMNLRLISAINYGNSMYPIANSPYFKGNDFTTLGDTNGDGLDDMMIGFTGSKKAVVLYGSHDWSSEKIMNFNITNVPKSMGYSIYCPTISLNGIQKAGDFNGDGLADFLLRCTVDTGENLFFILGTSFPDDINLNSISLSSNVIRISSMNEGDVIGSTVLSCGDMNGDQVDDVLIGIQGLFLHSIYSSLRLYLLFGSPVSSNERIILGENSHPHVLLQQANGDNSENGFLAFAVGDLNQDGYADLAICDFKTSIYIIFGSIFLGKDPILFLSPNIPLPSYILRLTLPKTGSLQNLYHVAAAGDYNGDDIRDLVISNGHNIYLFFGNSSSNWKEREIFITSIDVSNHPNLAILTGPSLTTAFRNVIAYQPQTHQRNTKKHIDHLLFFYINTGTIYLLYGQENILSLLRSNTFTMEEIGSHGLLIPSSSRLFGCTLISDIDWDHDGISDLFFNNYPTSETMSKIYFLSGKSLFDSHLPRDLPKEYIRSFASPAQGKPFAIGDWNHDGKSDILSVNLFQSDNHSCHIGTILLGAKDNLISNSNRLIDIPDERQVHLFDNCPLDLGDDQVYRYSLYFVVSVGDINQDGRDDFLINSFFDPKRNHNRLMIVFGTDTPKKELFLPELPERKEALNLLGMSSYAGFASAGDFNGDSIPDILITGNHSINGLIVIVLYGVSPLFLESSIDLLSFFQDPSKASKGRVLPGYSSRAAAVGDVNGDSFADLLIIDTSHVASILFGCINDADDAPSLFLYKLSSEWSFGNGAGDVNGDGFDDFIVSDIETVRLERKLYVFFGNNDPYQQGFRSILLHSPWDSSFGSTFLAADINHDAYSDLVIGDTARLAVLFGAKEWSNDIIQDITRQGITMRVSHSEIELLGDFDQDTVVDFGLGTNFLPGGLFFDPNEDTSSSSSMEKLSVEESMYEKLSKVFHQVIIELMVLSLFFLLIIAVLLVFILFSRKKADTFRGSSDKEREEEEESFIVLQRS